MLVRIVKLHFKEENIAAFKELFKNTAEKIQGFEGCRHLEGYQDKGNPRIFFTYSHWDNEEALEAYRHSPFFKSVWSRTKVLFDGKPMVWSLDKLDMEEH